MYERYLKRAIDIILSVITLVLLLPLMMFMSLIVRWRLGSPVFFKQDRPGRKEEIFTMYKFRTMTNERDEKGGLLPDSERLTKLGKFLRRSSIDELPELYNIVKGEMSIVGPRPLSPRYLPYYTEKERLRHTVRPGLTGLAQINGRNTTDWEERFNYDIKYVNNISIKMDVYTVLHTILKVIKRDGVAERGTTQVQDFHTHREAQKESGKLNERNESFK